MFSDQVSNRLLEKAGMIPEDVAVNWGAPEAHHICPDGVLTTERIL